VPNPDAVAPWRWFAEVPARHSGMQDQRSGIRTQQRHCTSHTLPQMMKAPILAITLPKGGVAKTTTTVNLAVALARRRPRVRVLVVDLDSQGHAGRALGVPRGHGTTIGSVIFDDVDACEAVQLTRVSGVSVLTGDARMGAYDASMAHLPPRERTAVLAKLLAPVRHTVDLILLDLPPGAGLLHIGAYVAADWALSPVTPEADAVEGLIDLQAHIEQARQNHDAPIREVGVLATTADLRTLEHRGNLREMREHLGSRMLATHIPMTTRVREASRAGKTVLEHSPKSTAAVAYRAAARELLTRLSSAREQR